MKMKYDLPDVPRDAIIKEKFASDIVRLFPDVSREHINLLFDLSVLTTKQVNGAMLVIVRDAKEEAARLRNRCIEIDPIRPTPEQYLNLTSIDGGVICDLSAVVYAHGVILDGIVGIEGDSSRGSRFNSAMTYCEYRGSTKPTLVVVVSEDGMVDVVPSLRPQIKHSDIEQIISILNELNSDSTFNRANFYDAMNWIANRKFYFLPSECETINPLKESLEELDQKLSQATMWIKHENLVPNPRMNETYYARE